MKEYTYVIGKGNFHFLKEEQIELFEIQATPLNIKEKIKEFQNTNKFWVTLHKKYITKKMIKEDIEYEMIVDSDIQNDLENQGYIELEKVQVFRIGYNTGFKVSSRAKEVLNRIAKSSPKHTIDRGLL